MTRQSKNVFWNQSSNSKLKRRAQTCYWTFERRQSAKSDPRSLLLNPRILILDEPTRGIDIGAKYEIYKLINQLVQQGIAVIVISSELPEVLGLSDRVLVMHEGKLKANLINHNWTQEQVMEDHVKQASYSEKSNPSEVKLAVPTSGGFSSKSLNLQVFVMIAAIIAIMLLFTWTTDGAYLSARNVSNLFHQTTITGILRGRNGVRHNFC